jgi:hypothetical protein
VRRRRNRRICILNPRFSRKARQFVEANHDAWYILSVKHHLLDPDGDPIEPYDETLSGVSVDTKREWAETVFEQLRAEGLLDDWNRFIFHAGRDYHEELTPLLSETSVEITSCQSNHVEYPPRHLKRHSPHDTGRNRVEVAESASGAMASRRGRSLVVKPTNYPDTPASHPETGCEWACSTNSPSQASMTKRFLISKPTDLNPTPVRPVVED